MRLAINKTIIYIFLGIVWLGALLVFTLPWLNPPHLLFKYQPEQLASASLENGKPTGFYPAETDTQGNTYSWTRSAASLLLNVEVKKPVHLTVELRRTGGPDKPVLVQANGVEIGQWQPDAAKTDFQTFNLKFVPPYGAYQYLEISLLTPTFQPEGAQRPVGVAVKNITLDFEEAWSSFGKWRWFSLGLPLLALLALGLSLVALRRRAALPGYAAVAVLLVGGLAALFMAYLVLRVGVVDSQTYTSWLLALLYMAVAFGLTALLLPFRNSNIHNLIQISYYWLFPQRRLAQINYNRWQGWKDWARLKLRILGQSAIILAFFGLLALTLLAPIASSTDYIPYVFSSHGHQGMLIQGQQALEEGQFPLRVAPWENDGFRYPIFQFYGQFPETLGALIYRYIAPTNFYLAYIIVNWLSLLVAGFFTYRTALWLTRSRLASILAGAAYMSAPYLLINIHGRGAMDEVVAQGLIALVLYTSLRCYAAPRFSWLVWCSLSWLGLLLSHFISFTYLSIFIALTLLCLGIKKRRAWQRLSRVLVAYALTFPLSMYYLGPILLEKNLFVNFSQFRNDPFSSAWQSTLPRLLAPVSIPAEPRPGARGEFVNVNPAVGWPVLVAWGIVIYYYLRPASLLKWPGWLRNSRFLVTPLLLTSFLAFLMTWSPFDFWKNLPDFLQVQATYQMLAQVVWAGALLVAYSLILVFQKLDLRHLAIGVIVLGIASSSYLPALKLYTSKPNLTLLKPTVSLVPFGKDSLRASYAYALSPSVQRVFGNEELYLITKSIGTEEDPIDIYQKTSFPNWFEGEKPVLHIEGYVKVQTLPPNTTLKVDVLVNDKKLKSFAMSEGEFIWDIPLEQVNLQNQRFKISFEDHNLFIKLPPLYLDAIRLTGLPPERSIIPVSETKRQFGQQGADTIGTVTVTDPLKPVQIPVLFYGNGLQEVRVDGQVVPYLPLLYQGQKYLVGLRLTSGTHEIKVSFTGYTWANWLSLASWVLLAFSIIVATIRWFLRFNFKPTTQEEQHVEETVQSY